MCVCVCVGKETTIQAWTGLDRPLVFQEVEAYRNSRQLSHEVTMFSALRTSRLYPLGDMPGTHFC
jgi:hypothetical protein